MIRQIVTLGASVALLLSLRETAAVERAPLRRVELAELAVSEGSIEPLPSGELAISAAKVRAVLPNRSPRSVELRFRALGPTASLAPLSDGEVRQQLGLKLRAQDACNVLYVMWRLEPRSVLAIHLKRNPGSRTSAECGARGYLALSAPVPLPRVQQGVAHVLRVDLDGDQLIVRVDGQLVWHGTLDASLPAAAPVGLRTDNVRVEFALAVEP